LKAVDPAAPHSSGAGWVGPTQVAFDRPLDDLPQLLPEATFGRRVAVIASPSQVALGRVAALEGRLGDHAARGFHRALVHTPVAQLAAATAAVEGATGLVALGGGAAIGTTKALAVALGIPYAAIPTTYSGSEMTPIFGIAEGGEKRIARDERARATVVLYDPSLPASLPPATLRMSLVNCLAHALDAFWLRDSTPLGDAIAVGARIRIECRAAEVGEERIDAAAARDLAAAAWLGGVALATSGVGFEHALAHAIGGVSGAPHAAIHTVVLPIAARLVDGPSERTDRLERLYADWRLPRSLAAIGIEEIDLDRVVALTLAAPGTSRCPRAIEAAGLRRALADLDR
jgi:alcohol dehydrogenase class IV